MLNQMLYNGQYVSGLGSEIDVVNPATLDTITTFKSATPKQLDDTVKASFDSFNLWKNISDVELKFILARIGQDIKAARDEIAELITLEQGKPLELAKLEVDMGIYWLEVTNSFEIPIKENKDSLGKKIKVYHHPIGVVASITPWNWPFMIAIWHIIPALKAKNCVINKPSEYTPLSTIRLIDIINKYIPKGVCNIVLGDGEIGSNLSNHPLIEKVIFTGSTPTGQKILASSVEQFRQVTLELGGNDVAIVLEDVDIDKIAPKIFASAFFNSGQTCACIKRLYVHDQVYEGLVKKLVEIADSQIIGNGFDKMTTLGPVQNIKQYQKLKILIEKAIKNGAHIENTRKLILPDTGYFLPPLILTNVLESSEIFTTEQFGPVLPIVKFSSIEDVINNSNHSSYALGGSIWTEDINKAEKIANQMQSGTVWINSHSDVSPYAEFGGWKMSGIGSTFGLDGLLQFTKRQSIHLSE
ncbi:aldehyde dehydrogenase family protein [Acinetobacter sp. C26M]|uniref:aldehyde dehydrogenase family protein n=1 Tax=unclassified Acinetobacter TaxID=196816 RepID=UPI002036D32A|nr:MULTISPECIES: aldehyde dehydrogenase family protein [unclassified Acinetobacter]USA47438.1 aldehyde dehydrogenase family protein [Acinetobacter sp. C26M]USA50919.1 aldehyde dehydrogenase family protein [Acinetobacter sp. C26G]